MIFNLHFTKVISCSFLSSRKNLITNNFSIFYIVHLLASNGSILSCSSIFQLSFKIFLGVLGTFVK